MGMAVVNDKSVVIMGLGYVGLPLAYEAQMAGLEVTGFDIDHEVVRRLKSGASHVDDISDGHIRDMVEAGFRATSDPTVIREADVVVICVPTPLSVSGGPDLSYVEDSVGLVSSSLRKGHLVILESTTYPGTTEELLVPGLEKSGLQVGVDFQVAFSPERIDPGNQAFGIANTPKVVGGFDQASTSRAAQFYERFVKEVVRSKGPREAELAKLIENTYRHVNIALMNELVKFCHELNIDLWDSIRCSATKPFGYEAFFPGPGVGGHCIPIDPNYLSHRIRTHLGQPFRFIELAQEINDSMPTYVARRAQELLNDEGKAVKGAEVLLLGVTYKANVADQRESPARDVALALEGLGARVHFNDPYIAKWSINDRVYHSQNPVTEAADSSDLIILLQAHREYLEMDEWPTGVPILDTRGVLAAPSVHSL